MSAPETIDVTPAEPGLAPAQIRRRFTELDGLRGAAALAVVLFHLRHSIEHLNPPAVLQTLVDGGFLMVDLFFPLSGFVLARTMLATRTAGDAGRFSALRARRFLPLHLTAMAIVFACVTLTWILQQQGFENTPKRPAFTGESESTWAWVSSLLLLPKGFLGPQISGYPGEWSLSIELGVNILLVAVIAAVAGFAPRRRSWVGPAALALGTLVLLLADPAAGITVGWTAFGRGLAGLGTGMIVYRVFTSTHRPATDGRRPEYLIGAGAAIALAALLIAVYFSDRIQDLRLLPMLPICAVLLYCLARSSSAPVHLLLNSRLLQWLGSRSFALYALHGAVLTAISLAVRLRGLALEDRKVAAFVIVTTLIGALAAAEIGHRFIERALTPKPSSATRSPRTDRRESPASGS